MQPGKVQDHLIQPLGLGPVDLEKRRHRQPEGQAAQLLLQIVPAPQGAVFLSQDHIGVPGVEIQHHPYKARAHPAQSIHKLLLEGQAGPVDHQAAQSLVTAVGTHIQVPDQPGAVLLPIGGDLISLHPFFHGPPQGGDGQGLEQAVRRIQHVVAAGAVIADGQPPLLLGHRELHLISIALRLLRPQHRGQFQLHAAHTLQRIGHPLALGLQLLGIGHVPELTAATPARQGTVGFQPLLGALQQLHSPGPGHVLRHLLQADGPALPPDGPRDKDHPALQPGHPHALGGVAGDLGGVDSIFLPVHAVHPLSPGTPGPCVALVCSIITRPGAGDKRKADSAAAQSAFLDALSYKEKITSRSSGPCWPPCGRRTGPYR